MANQRQLNLLKQGVDAWNEWRTEDIDLQVNLSKANLSGAILYDANLSDANLSDANLSNADLSNAHLSDANLSSANLSSANLFYADLSDAYLSSANLSNAYLGDAKLNGADLYRANLSGANLSRADLSGADLSGADLSRANLSGAILSDANLSGADLSGADLSGADLSNAKLVQINFTDATLLDCHIYGISAWGLELKGATQKNLVITPHGESIITVDNLEVAQFIYLLLNNPKIRDIIDTIARKAVLILGRFTPERKAVLDALRDALRTYGYLPILFDFDKPASRDITETVSTLAHLARFVIADITDAKSIPQELLLIVPNLPSVPVQPLILNSQHEYGMFEHFIRFPWVLPVYRYTDEGSLLQSLKKHVIEPAEQKARELEKR